MKREQRDKLAKELLFSQIGTGIVAICFLIALIAGATGGLNTGIIVALCFTGISIFYLGSRVNTIEKELREDDEKESK